MGLAVGDIAATDGLISPGLTGKVSDAQDLTHRAVFPHPNTAWFVLLYGDVVRIYSWSNFSELTPVNGKRIERPYEAPAPTTGMDAPLQSRHVRIKASYHVAKDCVVEFIEPYSTNRPRLHLWSASSLDPFSTEDTIRPADETNLYTVRHNCPLSSGSCWCVDFAVSGHQPVGVQCQPAINDDKHALVDRSWITSQGLCQ